MSRKDSYAQHFLASPSIASELIGHSNIRKNDVVYDLGAGSGVISYALSPRCKQVIAVEIETDALEKLKKNLFDIPNITIMKRDMLELTPREPKYKIFANIPFSLSSEVVRTYCNYENAPVALYLIVQRQFAKKLVPGSDHFTNELSASIGPLYTAKIRKPLKRSDFTPPPAVDTVLLELKRREETLLSVADIPRYQEWVARCFNDVTFFRKQLAKTSTLSLEKTPSMLHLSEWINVFTSLKR